MEQKRLLSQMDEERNSILSEKAKLETMARVQEFSGQPTLARCEIDAAVKVAQVRVCFYNLDISLNIYI